jgi:hypothetical protein
MSRYNWKRIALLALGAVGIALLYIGNAVVTTLAIVLIGLVQSFLRCAICRNVGRVKGCNQ